MTADIEKGPPYTNGTIQRKSKKGDILDLIGGDGPWQRRIFLVILLAAIPSATHNLSVTFLAPDLDHWCAPPPSAENLTVEQWRRIGLPPYDQQCSRYEITNITHLWKEDSNDTKEYNVVPCDAWDYDDTFYSSTVLSQWDLVCEQKWLVSLSKSIFMVGILLAVTLFGYLADRFGRRPAIAASSFIGFTSALICAFSTSFTMFMITRFFVAVGMSGCFNTCFVLLMEVVSPEFRPIYGLAVQFGWCLGFVSLPAIAWVLRDWFWIQIALTAPMVLLLGIYWMISESPRWMMSQGKVEEAYKVLSKAAVINGKNISDIDSTLKKAMTKANEGLESGESNKNIFDLLRTPGLWQIALNLYFIWFVNAFVYYGLSYNTNELAGDPFINFAVSGAVEFPACFVSIFAIRIFGRRNPLAGTMIIGGLACLLSYPLPQNPWWLTVTVSMIGKFCITCSFGIIFVFTTELFPTVVRNIGLGSASFCARFGSILAPFVRELGNATHPVVPQIAFGVLAAVSGALALFLPETNNCRVPDTLKEAAEMSKKRTKKHKLQNGNHLIVTLSNGDAESAVDDLNSQTIFAPSPKPQTNCKKLADVPEEDLHLDDPGEFGALSPEKAQETNSDSTDVTTVEASDNHIDVLKQSPEEIMEQETNESSAVEDPVIDKTAAITDVKESNPESEVVKVENESSDQQSEL